MFWSDVLNDVCGFFDFLEEMYEMENYFRVIKIKEVFWFLNKIISSILRENIIVLLLERKLL